MSTTTVTVSETVTSKKPGPRGLPPVRWVVVATFVGIDGAEPRCVDYRVRVVPDAPDASSSVRTAHRLIEELEAQAIPAHAVDALGEIPREGIPRYVFERASQARLLAKARAAASRRPGRYPADVRATLAQGTAKRAGRPPVRPLGEKLEILADVERAFAEGGKRADVAARHAMSSSALRDLLHWARHDHDPPLFTSYGPGKAGGELTPEARAYLANVEETRDDGER